MAVTGLEKSCLAFSLSAAFRWRDTRTSAESDTLVPAFSTPVRPHIRTKAACHLSPFPASHVASAFSSLKDPLSIITPFCFIRLTCLRCAVHVLHVEALHTTSLPRA